MLDIQPIKKIESVCLKNDLSCHDPYDIWMTDTGIFIKSLFNKNKYLGILPAATLTLWDHFLNNDLRWFYKKQEYPTVRAMAALSLLNLYAVYKKEDYIKFAKNHIQWLLGHSCKGYSGHCWGLGFKWAAGEGLDYNENTPFTTHTPYVLEALDQYIKVTGDISYVKYIESIFNFYEKDVKVLFENDDMLATSYGPSKDRLVTNAVSYTMYAYAIFLPYFPKKELLIKDKILKLYRFILNNQQEDGSWLYAPADKNSFIDCFHSCFILKNICKTNEIVPLDDAKKVMSLGYAYLKSNFLVFEDGLFKRFSLSNKPSIVKYDLYDNAEMMHLALLFKDMNFAQKLADTIYKKFVKDDEIFSIIDLFNLRKNRNTLRWAQMPYQYALSALESYKP